MPVGVVHSKADEAKWQEAKKAAAKSKNKNVEDLKDHDYALVMHIYENMKKSEKENQINISNINSLNSINNTLLLNKNTNEKQSISHSEVNNMAEDKKYSAREAGIAVMKKVEELIKSSDLYKKGKIKKSEKNPDEKEDAELGEGVEKLVDEHYEDVKEKGKDHDLKKSKETKHDRCVEHVKESSPEVKNPHAVCVAEGVKPEKWAKTEREVEKDDKNYEVSSEKEKSSEKERVREQTPPEFNPKEQAEGNNKEWGTAPETYGKLKLAKFLGYMEAKRKAKNGI